MNKQFLVVTFSDGSRYRIPVSVIFQDCVDYYTEEEGEDATEKVQEWFEDPDEIIDWAVSEMNWEDVEEYAEQIAPAVPVDPAEEWTGEDTEYEVIE